MPSKKSVSVTELLSEILDGDIDNLEEIAERKGEEAGERVSKNFAEGIEKGIRKGGRKVSGSVQVGMADFANDLIKAVEKLAKAPLRGQGKGFTIDMSKLITPDWSKVGLGKKNEANAQQAFSNMLQNIYKKRKSLGGDQEAIMNSFMEEAITYVNEFASNAKAGNSKSISTQLNKALRKSEKELNTRLTQRQHEKDSHNAITITQKEIDGYLSKSVEELVKIVESTYGKRDFSNNNILKNNADKKKLVASLTALMAKNNGKAPKSLNESNDIIKYVQDLIEGNIFQNISGIPNYKPTPQSASKYKKTGKQLSAVKEAVLSRNKDWEEGRVSEIEVSNEETKVVVENEEKKRQARKSTYRERQEAIKQERKENEERREQIRKEAEQEHVTERIKRDDLKWEKDDKGNYRTTYNGREYIAQKANNGKSFSLITVDDENNLQVTGKRTKNIRDMKKYVFELINAEKDENDVRAKNIEINKKAEEQAKQTEKAEKKVTETKEKQTKQEEKNNEEAKKTLFNNSGGAELARQRQKQDEAKRAIARKEAEENKKALAEAEEAEKQAKEELNNQAEEMYKAELDRRRKLSKMTFERKKDEDGRYWGSDGETSAIKEGRSYTLLDKMDNKIAEGLKNLNEVESAARDYHRQGYEEYRKNRKFYIQAIKDNIQAGLYQKPSADVVGGNNQKIIESEKQVQEAIKETANVRKEASKESSKETQVTETNKSISEQKNISKSIEETTSQIEQSEQRKQNAIKETTETVKEQAKVQEEINKNSDFSRDAQLELEQQSSKAKQDLIKQNIQLQNEEQRNLEQGLANQTNLLEQKKKQETYEKNLRKRAEELYELRVKAYEDRESSDLKFKQVDYSKHPEYNPDDTRVYFSEDGRYKATKYNRSRKYDIYEKTGDEYGRYPIAINVKKLSDAYWEINKGHGIQSSLYKYRDDAIKSIINELRANDLSLEKELERKKSIAEKFKIATQEEKDALFSQYPSAVVKEYKAKIEEAQKIVNSEIKFTRDKDHNYIYNSNIGDFTIYKKHNGKYNTLNDGYEDSSSIVGIINQIKKFKQYQIDNDSNLDEIKDHLDFSLKMYNKVKRLRAEGKVFESVYDQYEEDDTLKPKEEQNSAFETQKAEEQKQKAILDTSKFREQSLEQSQKETEQYQKNIQREMQLQNEQQRQNEDIANKNKQVALNAEKESARKAEEAKRKAEEERRRSEEEKKEEQKSPPSPNPPKPPKNPPTPPTPPQNPPSPFTPKTPRDWRKLMEGDRGYSQTYQEGLYRRVTQGGKYGVDENGLPTVEEFIETKTDYDNLIADTTKLMKDALSVESEIKIEKAKNGNNSPALKDLQSKLTLIDSQIQERIDRALFFEKEGKPNEQDETGFDFSAYLSNVTDGLKLFAANIEAKTNESIRKIEDSKKKLQAQVDEYVTGGKAKLSKVDKLYKTDPAYEAVDTALKGFSASTKEEFDQEKLKIDKLFNALDDVMGVSRSNLKGSNTLSTEKSAEFKLADAPRVIDSIVEGYIKLGLSTEEAKEKVKSLNEELEVINNPKTQWAGAKDQSSYVGNFLNGIRDANNELSKYRERITTINKYQRDATSALEQYFKAKKKVDMGEDADGRFAKQAKDELETYERIIKTREEYIKQTGMIKSGEKDTWAEEQNAYKQRREENLKKQVKEAKQQAEAKAKEKADKDIANQEAKDQAQKNADEKAAARIAKQQAEATKKQLAKEFSEKNDFVTKSVNDYLNSLFTGENITESTKKLEDAFKVLDELFWKPKQDGVGTYQDVWNSINNSIDETDKKFKGQLILSVANAKEAMEQFGDSAKDASAELDRMLVEDVFKNISGSKVGRNGLLNYFDQFSNFRNNVNKNIEKQYSEAATNWLNTNRSDRVSSVVDYLGSTNAINAATKAVDNLDQKLKEGKISVEQYNKAYTKLQKDWTNAISSYSFNPAENRDAMKQWVTMQAQGAAVTLKWSKDGQQLTGTFRNQNNELVKVVATADRFRGTVKGVVQEIKPMKTGIEAFFDSIGNKWQEVMRYMATYVSLRSVWTEFQKGINTVREYDKALTEMNKVSDASMYTLQNFQKESFGIADSVGVTASVVQNSTADWLRLGESLEQAKESAKASAILFNVSEFQDIGSATDALVSASQAYQELSKTDIIDKINYIGNNYSIATDGLASALQRSAAVLKTQGNDIDQAIALITAGNSIIQNPEMVAAGIRTISLRIAGTEEAKGQLVDMGEDVDDFIVQTHSKTQQVIKDYTAVASNAYKGVDVLDENGNLKDTYQILLEISKVYKEIQETDKKAGTNRANALVEALAGKNRSNIAASILNAPDLLESVYNDSAYMSAGSANEELNKQLESIEGHVNRLKNTYDELWTSAMNRDVINFFVDIGNGVLSLINNFGLLKTALAGLMSVLEFQNTMSGGGFLFGKSGLISKLFNGSIERTNAFKDLDLGILERYNDEFDLTGDRIAAYQKVASKANKTTKDFLHTQEGLVDLDLAGKLKSGKGDKFSSFVENGKELVKGLASGIGTAIVTYAAEAAIGFVWDQIDQKILHAHEYAVDKLKTSQSNVESGRAEIEDLDAQINSIDDQIKSINAQGGISLVKDGEIEKLKQQREELEEQKAIKQAMLDLDTASMYKDAKDVVKTNVEGYKYTGERTGQGYDDLFWGITKQSQPEALRNTIEYYNYAQKEASKAQQEFLELSKKGTIENENELRSLEERYSSFVDKANDARSMAISIYSNMSPAVSVLDSYQKVGNALSTIEEDFVAAGKEGKDFISTTTELSNSIETATITVRDFSHACVQTSTQLLEQKTSVDNLKASYQEIFSLLSSFTGTDIVLDDTQLTKYAYALEYVNGVYTLNKEKLLDVAKANNAVQKSSLEEFRHTERMQLLDNIDEIEKYTKLLNEGQKTYQGIDISNYISQLQAENQQILNNCKVYDYQISQIDNMTSAYQRWLDTGEVAKDAKQFTDVQSSAKNLDELIKNGYYNSEAAKHEIEFIIPEDISAQGKDAVIKLAKEYNEYFADGIKGTNKFVQKALKETLEDGTHLIEKLDNGEYAFGKGVTVEDFMEKFGWSESAVRAMIQELHDAQGWTIDWSLDNLTTLEDKVVHTQQTISDYEAQIKELEGKSTPTAEDIKNLENLKQKLSEVKKEYSEMRDEFSKQLFSDIRDNLEENGGSRKIFNDVLAHSSNAKEMSDYVKEKTGITTEYQVKVYTDEAQNNIKDLKKEYQELKNLYEDPITPNWKKVEVKELMNGIETELGTEEFNLRLLSLIDFDNSGITTENTSENILSTVQDIRGTLGRIADKFAPTPMTEQIGETVKEKINTAKQKYVEKKVENTTSSETFFERNAPESLETTVIKKVKTEVEPINVDKAQESFENLRKIQEQTTGVKSSTVTVYGIEHTLQQYRELYRMQQLLNRGGGGYDSTYYGNHQVTGNVFAKGDAFARGNNIVGEQGRELVVDPNKGIWYTVGNNGTEMIDLPKDAIIYSHNQTEALLKSGVTSRGKSTGRSFAEGNAYPRGGGVLESSSTGGNSGNRNSNGKDAADAAKSAEKSAKSAKDAADKAKQTIDWIDRALEYQNHELKKIKDLLDDDFEPYEDRFVALEEYEEQLTEQEEVLYQAIERRNEKLEEESQKLKDLIGEEKAELIIERVQMGDVDPDEWLEDFTKEFGEETGTKAHEIVAEMEKAQKNIESAEDAYTDNMKEQREVEQKRFEMRLNIIKAEKELIDYQMDVLQHNLDMKDILGRMVVEQDYQDMIDQTDEIADNLRKQLEVLEEQAGTLPKTSQEYYNVQQEIHSVKKELMECEKNQAEWNDKIMRLPIERLDKYLGMLENIKKDLSNWISERDTLGITTLNKTIGQQFEIITKQIAKYNEQIDKYRELISNYEYGSDKFEETANAIQGIEDNVSSLIQEMEQLNMQFLKLPIEEITKANEKLQNINSAEQRVLDDYDTALSAVLSLFDKQIDRLNDDKDYWDEYYEKLIKPEQEKLDLLNEQNEAKQVQYNIDKAQYDLDKARQQKNVQVVRNGRIEYDSDLDAIKNASDALKDAELDKVKYDIQQVIDGYEKLNEKKQEELDDEIEAYDDARNRWQTFEDERTFEKESAEAERLFGKGWENAIISRKDDREYDIFSKGHIELDRQITANEKQIEANERMIDLMTRYADAFLSGEMTYEQAVAQYTKLYNDYQSGGALVSQESLAAELAFNNAKTMAEALTGNNKTTKEQYDIFLKQLEKSNDYKAVYEPLQKNWADMAMNIEAQLKELEELARLAEEIASNTRSGRGSSDDDDDGGRGEWSRNPTGYGAGTKYNPNGTGTLYVSDSDNPGGISKSTYGTTGKYFDAESGTFKSYVSGSSIASKIKDAVSDIVSSYNSSGGGSDRDVNVESRGSTTVEAKSVEVKSDSKPSGPASDPDYTSRGKGPRAYADGLAKGMIGNIPASEKFKKLQAMGLKPLEPNEVPAFLHVGEGVVNAIQQDNILQSVANAFKSGVASAIPADAVRSVENNYHIDCTFGDFNLPGVQDVNGFADAMKNNFESIMNQQFSKMF